MNDEYPLPDLSPDIEDPGHKPFPGLLTLQKMQSLAVQGYSDEEIEEMCKPKTLTEEERAILYTSIEKEHRKEIRAFERARKKREEHEKLCAIYKKLSGA